MHTRVFAVSVCKFCVESSTAVKDAERQDEKVGSCVDRMDRWTGGSYSLCVCKFVPRPQYRLGGGQHAWL